MEQQKKLLILDIDETLISSTITPYNNIKYDFMINLDDNIYYIKKRPFLDEFLTYCNENFRLGFWSAGGADYVEAIIKLITPTIAPVFVWSFKKCTLKPISSLYYSLNSGYYIIKRLQKVWKTKNFNTTKETTLILDDTPSTYKCNYGNAIPISKFYGNNLDIELLNVKWLLEYKLKTCNNVRVVDKIYSNSDIEDI